MKINKTPCERRVSVITYNTSESFVIFPDMEVREMDAVARSVDMVWVTLSAILVIFMQAGFALLEAGSTRMKNAGHIAGKQVLSFALAGIAFWAVGYAIAFGEGTPLFGRSEEHTSELQSREKLVCRLPREKKKWAPRAR